MTEMNRHMNTVRSAHVSMGAFGMAYYRYYYTLSLR